MQPIGETVAGENLPYRGTVDHGVPYTGVDPIDESRMWADSDKTDYETEEKVADPIPVRVVNQGSREIKTFSSALYEIPAGPTSLDPVQICGRDEKRTQITIYHRGSETLWVASSRDDFATNSQGGPAYRAFPLAAEGKLTLSTTEPVWISGNEDVPSPTYVLIERTEAVS